MRTRIAAAAIAAAALLTLTACNSDDNKSSAPNSTPTVDISSAEAAAGIPAAPDAAKQAVLLAAIAAVDPSLANNPDKAVRNSRNQCQALDAGTANPDHAAAQRFGNDAHPLTDAQGAALNAALRATLCPKK
jgi:hypothetical protein